MKTELSTLKTLDEWQRKLIFEITDYAILLLDKKGAILSWNKGADIIIGYSEEEVKGKILTSFILQMKITCRPRIH